MTTVIGLQRSYRTLVRKIKKTGEPMIVVGSGEPGVVVMDIKTYEAQSKKIKELEEASLLRIAMVFLPAPRPGLPLTFFGPK
jgi:PHD/YefM family antitoxin component YafN of YafNO toxin-antitoxin module